MQDFEFVDRKLHTPILESDKIKLRSIAAEKNMPLYAALHEIMGTVNQKEALAQYILLRTKNRLSDVIYAVDDIEAGVDVYEKLNETAKTEKRALFTNFFDILCSKKFWAEMEALAGVSQFVVPLSDKFFLADCIFRRDVVNMLFSVETFVINHDPNFLAMSVRPWERMKYFFDNEDELKMNISKFRKADSVMETIIPKKAYTKIVGKMELTTDDFEQGHVLYC